MNEYQFDTVLRLFETVLSFAPQQVGDDEYTVTSAATEIQDLTDHIDNLEDDIEDLEEDLYVANVYIDSLEKQIYDNINNNDNINNIAELGSN